MEQNSEKEVQLTFSCCNDRLRRVVLYLVYWRLGDRQTSQILSRGVVGSENALKTAFINHAIFDVPVHGLGDLYLCFMMCDYSQRQFRVSWLPVISDLQAHLK